MKSQDYLRMKYKKLKIFFYYMNKYILNYMEINKNKDMIIYYIKF
jgi:hypothetical protein